MQLPQEILLAVKGTAMQDFLPLGKNVLVNPHPTGSSALKQSPKMVEPWRTALVLPESCFAARQLDLQAFLSMLLSRAVGQTGTPLRNCPQPAPPERKIFARASGTAARVTHDALTQKLLPQHELADKRRSVRVLGYSANRSLIVVVTG